MQACICQSSRTIAPTCPSLVSILKSSPSYCPSIAKAHMHRATTGILMRDRECASAPAGPLDPEAATPGGLRSLEDWAASADIGCSGRREAEKDSLLWEGASAPGSFALALGRLLLTRPSSWARATNRSLMPPNRSSSTWPTFMDGVGKGMSCTGMSLDTCR